MRHHKIMTIVTVEKVRLRDLSLLNWMNWTNNLSIGHNRYWKLSRISRDSSSKQNCLRSPSFPYHKKVKETWLAPIAQLPLIRYSSPYLRGLIWFYVHYFGYVSQFKPHVEAIFVISKLFKALCDISWIYKVRVNSLLSGLVVNHNCTFIKLLSLYLIYLLFSFHNNLGQTKLDSLNAREMH